MVKNILKTGGVVLAGAALLYIAGLMKEWVQELMEDVNG